MSIQLHNSEFFGAAVGFVPGLSAVAGPVKYSSFSAKADQIGQLADKAIPATLKSAYASEAVVNRKLARLSLLEMIPGVNVLAAVASVVVLRQLSESRAQVAREALKPVYDQVQQASQRRAAVKKWCEGARDGGHYLKAVCLVLDLQSLEKLINSGLKADAFSEALKYVKGKSDFLMGKAHYDTLIAALLNSAEGIQDPLKVAKVTF